MAPAARLAVVSAAWVAALLPVTGCGGGGGGTEELSLVRSALPGEEHRLFRRGHSPAEPGRYDWPEWLGPSRNGTSAEAAWRADWSHRPPEVLWRRRVGAGYSAVSIRGGLAYTMGNADGKDSVWCLDAATGAVVWTFSYPCAKGLFAGPRATPAVGGAYVCALDREGRLYCLRAATGEKLWSRNLIAHVRWKGLGWKWGTSASPLLLGGTVVVDVGTAFAFDLATGALRWKSGQYETAYASPVTMPAAGTGEVSDRRASRPGPRLVMLNGERLRILDPADGRECCSWQWTCRGTNIPSPVVAGSHVLLTSGYGRGCALLKFDQGRLEKAYESRVLGSHIHTPVVRDGFVYGFHGDVCLLSGSPTARASLKCIELATGRERWATTRLGYGMLIAAGPRLIALTERGCLVAVEATAAAYRELGSHRVFRGRCWTAPVLANGRIYCRGPGGEVVCLDVRPGGA